MALASVCAAIPARRRATVSCSSASRHECTVVITTTVASVIAAIHAAYWTLMLYREAIRAALRGHAPFRLALFQFLPGSIKRQARPDPIGANRGLLDIRARHHNVPIRCQSRRRAAGSTLCVFSWTGGRRHPLENNGLVFYSSRSGSGLGSRSRLRHLPGNGQVLGAVRTRNDEPGTSLIDHQVLSARFAEKVDVDRSSSGASSDIGPNLPGYYQLQVPVARKEIRGLPSRQSPHSKPGNRSDRRS